MRMIKRTALALGVGSALVLGATGISLAAPTATLAGPATAADDDNGLLGILGGDNDNDKNDDDDSLGESLSDDSDDSDDSDEESRVTYRCDDDENEGNELLDLDGLNLVAILQGVNVLGLDLGDCGKRRQRRQRRPARRPAGRRRRQRRRRPRRGARLGPQGSPGRPARRRRQRGRRQRRHRRQRRPGQRRGRRGQRPRWRPPRRQLTHRVSRSALGGGVQHGRPGVDLDTGVAALLAEGDLGGVEEVPPLEGDELLDA